MVRPGPPEYLSGRAWAEGPARRVSPARPEVCPCRARHASIGPGRVRARAGRHVWTRIVWPPAIISVACVSLAQDDHAGRRHRQRECMGATVDGIIRPSLHERCSEMQCKQQRTIPYHTRGLFGSIACIGFRNLARRSWDGLQKPASTNLRKLNEPNFCQFPQVLEGSNV